MQTTAQTNSGHVAGGKQVADPRLLPCPFCGGNASLEYFGDYVVFCTCGGGMNKQFHEYQDAIAAWNRRAVNAHDDLVASLNDLYTLIHDMGWTTADDRYVSITNAAAVLAKAGA